MKKVITWTTIGFVLLCIVAVMGPSSAGASSRCATGGSPYTYTRGGYTVKLNHYRDVRGMACSSVRYVVNRWLRHKIARQYGWPHIGGPFWDGYVTWHCHKTSVYYWRCHENTSGTVFSFRGIVLN